MISQFNIVDILLQYFCLLFSLSVHEASHAAMANRCGDPTARLLGRMTLNPLAHIDPIGTVAMPLLMMVTRFPFMFGWAKPVPVNPGNFRNMRNGEILVSLAGPGSNLFLAICTALLLRFVVTVFGDQNAAVPILLYLAAINIGLMLFNLIPVHPLDGSHVLYHLLPRGGQEMMERIGPYGLIIVLLVARPIIQVPFNILFVLLMSFAGLGRA